MLIVMTILFLSVGDIYGQSCKDMFKTECSVIDPPEGLPRNKEELDQVCRVLHKMASCIAHVAETCSDESEIFVPREIISAMANQIVASLERACDQESSNYKVIANNIECISSNLPSIERKCRPSTISEKRRNLTMAYAENVQNKNDNQRGLYMNCIEAVYGISCFTALASEECGGEIFEPTLQTLMEVLKFNLDAMCSDETIEEIPMFAFAFAMVEKEAAHENNEIGELLQAPHINLFPGLRK